MSVGLDGPSSDPQEFRLVHVCSSIAGLHPHPVVSLVFVLNHISYHRNSFYPWYAPKPSSSGRTCALCITAASTWSD